MQESYSYEYHPPEPIKTPEQELEFLRAKIEKKQQELEPPVSTLDKERIVKKELQNYADTPDEEVLHEAFKEPEHSILKTALELQEEEHDTQIDELLNIVQQKGIKNALAVAEKIQSTHLLDDFHRALVQYVLKGMPGSELPQKSELWRALHMTLYEVWISDQDKETKQDVPEDLAKLIASMEQFYMGMLSVNEQDNKNVFTVEVAKPQSTEAVSFYVSVPTSKKSLFEKHMLSIFPNAKIDEKRSDYNIFTYGGVHTGAHAQLKKHACLPFKTFDSFTHDPLNVILSAFSKLSKHDEGAALQIVIGNVGESYNRQYKKIFDLVNKGFKLKDAIKRSTTMGKVVGDFADALKDALFNIKRENKEADQIILELIKRKIESRVVPVNLRIFSSAKTQQRADEILSDLSASFEQFEEPQGNDILFHLYKDVYKATKNFIFRSYSPDEEIDLSVRELSTIYHLTAVAVKTSRELKKAKAKGRPAPIEVSEVASSVESKESKGAIQLGVNIYGNQQTPVYFLEEDRLRHFYEIGQTGTGKTYLMKSMIIQDIYNGDGVCYIDPHGSDVEDILSFIPPNRWEDVIYFDPAYIQRPMGLNMYEYDPNHPEQKSFVVDEMLSIFEKLFESVPESMGPMFQQYFRNASLLIVDDPNDIGTIADVPRVMADKEYRHSLLAKTQNPLVKQFWKSAEATTGEQGLENFVPYITSKTDIFLANEYIRPIIAQKKSTLNFSDIMNNKKILLVNLSKGKIGELNANLLGLIIVGKFLQAAFARVDMPAEQRNPFYLYIDEFQNFTTPSIATILSEARKYKLSLNIAHQFVAQLSDEIRDAVFGNVGTKCVFRVGTEDGEFFEKVLAPDISAQDVTTQENRHAYLSLLVNGMPVKPFPINTLPIKYKSEPAQVEALKEYSYKRYGRDRQEVEEEIRRNYMQSLMKESPMPDTPGF